jgi:hypothetical protein
MVGMSSISAFYLPFMSGDIEKNRTAIREFNERKAKNSANMNDMKAVDSGAASLRDNYHWGKAGKSK